MTSSYRAAPRLGAIALCSVLAACGADQGGVDEGAVDQGVGVDAPMAPDGSGPRDGSTSSRLPMDVTCTGAPPATQVAWNNSIESPIIAAASPRHRVYDLVTSTAQASQTIGGLMAYGIDDKSLEGEIVEVYACVSGAWTSLGTSTTDDGGHFSVVLEGASSLPIGMRTLSAVVLGDLTTAPGVAIVTAPGKSLAASDVDGTLTSSEDAFPESLATGATVAPNDGAAAALTTIAELGYPLVYVTARGDVFTADTRTWLAANGFPLGAVRLATSLITLPGDETVAYKSGVLQALIASDLVVAIGLGNRATDQAAYAGASVPATQTFLKIPEFITEVQPLLDQHLAVGITSYATSESVFAALPPAP